MDLAGRASGNHIRRRESRIYTFWIGAATLTALAALPGVQSSTSGGEGVRHLGSAHRGRPGGA